MGFKKLESFSIEELRELYNNLHVIRNKLDRLALMNKREKDKTFTAFAKREFLNVGAEYSSIIPSFQHAESISINSAIRKNFTNAWTTKRKSSIRGKIKNTSANIDSLCSLIVTIIESKR